MPIAAASVSGGIASPHGERYERGCRKGVTEVGLTPTGLARSLLRDHGRRRSTIFGWAPRSAPQHADDAEKQDALPAGPMAASSADVPPDVEALLESAHIEGLPYRDFSASRREFRAGMRHRAALARRDVEAKAKRAAEQAAAEADHASRHAGEQARRHAAEARRALQRQLGSQAAAAEAARERALLQADQLSRRAAAERVEAARHAEALRAAEQTARREILDLTQTQAAAQQQVDTDRAEAVPRARPGGDTPDEGNARPEGMEPLRVPTRRNAERWQALGGVSPISEGDGALDPTATLGADEFAPVLLPDLSASETADVVEQFARSIRETEARAAAEAPEPLNTASFGGPEVRSPPEMASLASAEFVEHGPAAGSVAAEAPSWIADSPEPASGLGRYAFRETLQHSRETVASRWYALRRLFGSTAPDDEPPGLDREDKATPVLGMYSIAGGVGKTSLAASLTRALAARGERVLLVDTTGRGLLPYYLGAREPRAEEMRTFAPPQGGVEQPIQLMTPEAADDETSGRRSLAGLKAVRVQFSRVVVDIAAGDTETVRELVGLGAEIVVLLAPDMNSAVSLPALKQLFASARGAADQLSKTAFLITQFDATQPLQLDIRELFQQLLGDGLLPFSVRRSAAVAEALAEGMTVVDYAPEEGVTKDILHFANWVRRQAEPARAGFAAARWSER